MLRKAAPNSSVCAPALGGALKPSRCVCRCSDPSSFVAQVASRELGRGGIEVVGVHYWAGSGSLREASGIFWEASGNLREASGSIGKLLEALGSFWKLWEASRKPQEACESLWKASGKLLGSFWEASGKLLGSLRDASGSFWESQGSFQKLQKTCSEHNQASRMCAPEHKYPLFELSGAQSFRRLLGERERKEGRKEEGQPAGLSRPSLKERAGAGDEAACDWQALHTVIYHRTKLY